ncbi:uncharacterized protein Z518_06147 [Rhinocladiella mackenziei CBS 650.93]|uniref:Uncharacterized protein n=1 Tax=Rhinocladiella mackenziei CBS 650.93 TaxID=1442369 RepID=A0A0D2J873_9EURO|nr:uncharacterized protein Z518_06147 [Rhinocladiella mackenziei CBS 650.93]KIX05275.1 hypothetical protein Z518_06147 [Rhinocladiella mackenziei CBS 650.93]
MLRSNRSATEGCSETSPTAPQPRRQYTALSPKTPLRSAPDDYFQPLFGRHWKEVGILSVGCHFRSATWSSWKDYVHELDHRERSRSHRASLGVPVSYHLAFGLGPASGATPSNWLCDSLSWRWAFGIQVLLIGVCFVMAALFTPSNLGSMLINTGDGGAWIALKNSDNLGSLSLVITVTSLTLALSFEGNIFPWTSSVVTACFVIFDVVGCGFVYIETKEEQPLVPLHLLSKPPITSMVFANLPGGIASNAILFNLPHFFQTVLLTSAPGSGFRLALPSLIGSFAGMPSRYNMTYTRRLKPTLVAGAFIYLVGSIAISSITTNTSKIMSLILIAEVPLG